MRRNSITGPYVATIASVFILACQGVSSLAVAADVPRIALAWKARQKAFNSYFYSAKGTAFVPKGAYSRYLPDASHGAVPSSDLSMPVELQWALDFKHNRLAKSGCDILLNPAKGKLYVQRYQNLFDGSAFQSLVPRDREADIGLPLDKYRPELYIRKDVGADSAFFDPCDLPILMSFGIVSDPARNLQPALLFDSGIDGYSKVSEVELYGRKHSLLRSGPISASDSYIELWVDGERDCAVSKWLYYAEGKVHRQIDMEHKWIDDQWLVESWTVSRFKKTRLECTVEMRVERREANPSFSDALFHLTPHAGQIVQNNVTGTVVMKGEDGQSDVPVSRLIAMERYAGGGSLGMVVVGIVLGLAVTVVYVFYRFAKSRSSLRS